MMEQKTDPPNLGFWTLDLAYFHFICAIFQKKQLCARETEVLKGDNSAKIEKF